MLGTLPYYPHCYPYRPLALVIIVLNQQTVNIQNQEESVFAGTTNL